MDVGLAALRVGEQERRSLLRPVRIAGCNCLAVFGEPNSMYTCPLQSALQESEFASPHTAFRGRIRTTSGIVLSLPQANPKLLFWNAATMITTREQQRRPAWVADVYQRSSLSSWGGVACVPRETDSAQNIKHRTA